jgi:hypothetical protein
MAIIVIDVFVVVVISLSPLSLYGWKHRPCEALNAILVLHPLASACCSTGIETIVIATTPNNASAATMAITTNVVLLISELKKTLFLKSSATRLHYETFFAD